MKEDPLDSLYRRFGPAIHRRARALLGGDEEAAFDITQDTFLAYMRGRTALRGAASTFTVLYQIATYKAVDRLRHKARWSGVLDSLEFSDDDDPRHPSAAPSSGGGMPRVEALRDLSLLTEGESHQVLTAAVLYFVEGYTLDEVARALELSRRKVSQMFKKLAVRARQRSGPAERELQCL